MEDDLTSRTEIWELEVDYVKKLIVMNLICFT